MNLADVLSDKPVSARTEESATDDKPRIEVDEPLGHDSGPESAAPSAAKEPEQPEPAKAEQEEPTQGRDDKGRFQKTVPQEALHAERQKRQAVEAELAKLREQKPPPSVLEDEDGAFNTRIATALQPWQERFFKLSIKAARNVTGRDDYDEVSRAFMDAADQDPQLMAGFRNHDDPGEFAYTVGKQIRELADVNGDILKYGDKKRAEGAAEVANLKQQLAAKDAEIASLKTSKDKQAKIPQSLNGEPSATTQSPQFAGPTPMKNILN